MTKVVLIRLRTFDVCVGNTGCLHFSHHTSMPKGPVVGVRGFIGDCCCLPGIPSHHHLSILEFDQGLTRPKKLAHGMTGKDWLNFIWTTLAISSMWGLSVTPMALENILVLHLRYIWDSSSLKFLPNFLEYYVLFFLVGCVYWSLLNINC